MNPDQILLSHSGLGRLEMIVSRVVSTVTALQRAWASARARRELHDLSDRTLKDIGLSRAQIDALFR
jgi:uncharacterized protein YjiS (DUF1127 family)